MTLKAVSVLLLWLLSIGMAMANNARVVLIADESNPVHQQFIEGFRDNLSEASVVIMARDDITAESFDGASLVVPVGILSAREPLLRTLQVPVLYSLITMTDWQRLDKEKLVAPNRSVLYLGQPPERMLALVKTALSHRVKLTILLGPNSREEMLDIERGCQRLGFQCDSLVALDESGIDKAQLRAAARDKVLLVLPDSRIVNSDTARNLVLGAYLRGVALVGYSQAIVKAGALMAVHSTPAQLGADTAEMVREFRQQNRQQLPLPRYPTHYLVTVNYQLARALHLSLGTEGQLAEAIYKVERNE